MAERRRGAARSESARIAVLETTAALFAERGYDHLTIEGIAAEAGVAKQTIYRWWKSKSELVAECLFEGRLLPVDLVPPDSGDIRNDLTTWLDALFRFTDAPENGGLVRSLVIVAAENESVGRQLDASLGVSTLLTTRLGAATKAGDLPAGTPLKEVVDTLIGAVLVHVLQRTPAAPGAAKRLVSLLLP
ncbi:TetR/AcrR family transcriptional regulator [Promicromonospora soli]|uniref:TetR family transcriptional regulator n=1 Tax=Promicromonospora soli TaxID=2035533 RepID=A0A919G861_9MICO|nr:TetR/AcrR family transcriptional regulator [Promicromonospora soli]GHH79499.1 TetR family transcriptional regulator [Promicromonospora soli]